MTTKCDQRKRLTFIQCHRLAIGMEIGCPSPEEEEALRAEQHERDLWIAEAAGHCRCADLWKPCEGVLAGGICDELTEDEDGEGEDWWDEGELRGEIDDMVRGVAMAGEDNGIQ